MGMSSRTKLIISTPLLVALVACAPVDHGMGEAVKYNALAQTINPDPVYVPGGAQAGDNGVKGQKATERYRKDAVKAIERETTASGSSGSGGGSK